MGVQFPAYTAGVWSLLSCALTLVCQANSSGQTCHTLSVDGSLSLQQSLEQLLNLTRDTNSDDSRERSDSNCSRVELPSGVHYISTPLFFPAQLNDIEVVGLGDNVTVACSYPDSDTNFTWCFQRLESVRMAGIQFEACPLPLRLDTIAEVLITDCSFRSCR